jgi:hypothetical protein
MDSFRLPLTEVEEPRNIQDNKDGFSSNIVYDTNKNGTVYATKRPGLEAFASALGKGQAIYNYEDSLFAFTGTPYRWETGKWNGFKYIVVQRPSALWPVSSIFQETYFFVLTSEDGVIWEVQVVELPLPYNNSVFTDSVMHGDLFVAVTSSIYNTNPKASFVTEDGINWTRGELQNESGLGNANKPRSYLASNGTTIVSLPWASGLTVQTSLGGLTWTTRTAFPINTYAKAIGASSSLFVILPYEDTDSNDNGNLFYTSEDGTTWTQRTLPWTRKWESVTYSEELDRFVAVSLNVYELGEEPMIIYSDDGINWTQATYVPRSTYDPNFVVGWGNVTWTGSMFVAVFQKGYSISVDGIVWTDYFYPTAQNNGVSYQYTMSDSTDAVMVLPSMRQIRILTDSGTVGKFSEVPVIYNPLIPGIY